MPLEEEFKIGILEAEDSNKELFSSFSSLSISLSIFLTLFNNLC